jgi:1-phosphofructokinase family hexose kinase
MILTVTLNPSVDHALFVDAIQLNDTNRVKRTERDAGGKGINVARVAAELGADVLATGFLAGGPGAYIRNVLDRQNVKHDFVEVDGETRINFSVEDDSKAPPTTFNEPGPTVTSQNFEELREHCKRMSKSASWMCIGGSLPPGAPKEAFKVLIDDCRSKGCSIVLDADGEPMKLGVQAGPTFIKPNTKEASRLIGRSLETQEDCIEAARALLTQLQNSQDGRHPIVVISRGEKGAVLATQNLVFIGGSPQVKTNSTIGSGDSLIAGVLWAIEEGKSMEEAFQWGLAAGAATATTNGSEIARGPIVLDLFPKAKVESG